MCTFAYKIIHTYIYSRDNQHSHYHAWYNTFLHLLFSLLSVVQVSIPASRYFIQLIIIPVSQLLKLVNIINNNIIIILYILRNCYEWLWAGQKGSLIYLINLSITLFMGACAHAVPTYRYKYALAYRQKHMSATNIYHIIIRHNYVHIIKLFLVISLIIFVCT